MKVKDRQRCVQQHFPPPRQPPFLDPFEISRPPAAEQKQAGRQRKEQSALSDKQGERQTLPRQFALQIGKFAVFEKSDRRKAAVAEKAREREGAAPAPERNPCACTAHEPHPDQAAEVIDSHQRQEAVKEIHAERIGERAAREDGVFRPERRALRELPEVGQMQRKVAEVVWREDLDGVAIGEDEPQKRAQREEREKDDRGPFRTVKPARAQRHRRLVPQRGPGNDHARSERHRS